MTSIVSIMIFTRTNVEGAGRCIFVIWCYVTDTRRAGTFNACLDPEECETERQFWTDKLKKYASVQEQNPGAFDYLNEVEIFHVRAPLLDFEPSDASFRPKVH